MSDRIDSIKVLDIATSNRIAAGEVVERPASVVKELVENSLDAGASAITVQITDGGITRIRVTDNGKGIPPSDVRLAFERHATSKIVSGDPLTDIGTLGFRGEALPSIAAVTKLKLTTRVRGGDEGVSISIEGGRITDMRAAGCPQGTTVIAEDLFFNTPARKKFLKRPATEGGLVSDVMTQLALSRPDIAFKFIMNDRNVFQTPGDGKLKSAVFTIFGSATLSDMLEVHGQSGYVKVDGFIGTKGATRGTRQYELTFVNGRSVRSPIIYQGLEAALKERIMIGRYPMCAINITVPMNTVDVNCSPAKSEVRFADEEYVRQAVYDIVANSYAPNISSSIMSSIIGIKEPLPENKTITDVSEPAVKAAIKEEPKIDIKENSKPQAEKVPEKEPIPDVREEKKAEPSYHPYKRNEEGVFDALPQKRVLRDSLFSFTPPPAPVIQAPKEDPQPAAQPQPIITEEVLPAQQMFIAEEDIKMPDYTVFGQAMDTYIFIACGQSVFVLDQHAAHERLLFDKFSKQLLGGDPPAQKLLTPMIFDVSAMDKQRILDNAQVLHDAGFEVEEFGPLAIKLSSAPMILGQPQVSSFFTDFVDRLDTLSDIREPENKRMSIIKLACRKAIKAGDRLTKQEIDALLRQLLLSDSPPTCPHGRPIFIEITQKELEKRFRRVT